MAGREHPSAGMSGSEASGDATPASLDMRSAASPLGRVGDRPPSGRGEQSSHPMTSHPRGERSPVPVLYIGGCQRSGSTLLDRMMSQTPGHVSAGEIVHLWARGLRANELCGCGERFSVCPFWTEVGRVAFGGWESVDLDEVVRLQGRVDRNRYIIFMLLPQVAPRYRRELQRYVDILDALYRAVYRVGEGVVVDSSKHASTAFLLRRVPSVRLRIVHLVRDSRGVAFSLSKQVRRPESVDEETYMFRSSSWRSGLEWLAFNGLFHVIRVLGTPTTMARYEALVREPHAVLEGILRAEKGSVAADELAFIDGATVQLDTDHTVAGNPMRFQHGSFELRVDDAWRTSLDLRDRRITTVITWPLLVAYGYLRGEGR
jgi:hypothetical protein